MIGSASREVAVVDDDAAITAAVASLVTGMGHHARVYHQADEFLESLNERIPNCLVLDLKLPGLTGLELQRELHDKGMFIPTIIVTGHADVKTTVQALRQGALTLLEKPYSAADLQREIQAAIDLDEKLQQQCVTNWNAKSRMARLSVKEQEVLDMLVEGQGNKSMATALGLSVRSIEDRRRHLKRKLGVKSTAEAILIHHKSTIVTAPHWLIAENSVRR